MSGGVCQARAGGFAKFVGAGHRVHLEAAREIIGESAQWQNSNAETSSAVDESSRKRLERA